MEVEGAREEIAQAFMRWLDEQNKPLEVNGQAGYAFTEAEVERFASAFMAGVACCRDLVIR